MGSLLRTAKKHKKSRRFGKPEVMAREEYGELEVDVKIEMIRSLIPLGLMHVHELLADEVKELAGERYARKDELECGRRHGTNPGTVGLAGQRVPIRVPRVRRRWSHGIDDRAPSRIFSSGTSARSETALARVATNRRSGRQGSGATY